MNTSRKPIVYTLIMTASLSISSLALAVEEEDESGWSFEIMAGTTYEPTYVGSDKYLTEIDGNIEASYHTDGAEYFISLGEIGANFELRDGWGVASFLEYEPGRENANDTTLKHFPKMKDTWEGQFAITKEMGDWTAFSVLQPDLLNRGKGIVYFAGVEHRAQPFHKLTINTTLDVSFANAEHINTEVGISDDVATRSGLKAYNANGGYKSTSLGVQAGYELSDRWMLVSHVEAEFYGNNVANSPLVKDEGSAVTYTLGLGLLYSF